MSHTSNGNAFVGFRRARGFRRGHTAVGGGAAAATAVGGGAATAFDAVRRNAVDGPERDGFAARCTGVYLTLYDGGLRGGFPVLVPP